MITKVDYNEDGFTGFIEIDIPKFTERLDIVKKATLENNELVDKVDHAKYLIELAHEKTKNVYLKRNEKEFKTLSELEIYTEGVKVLYKIGSYICNGVPLGNN